MTDHQQTFEESRLNYHTLTRSSVLDTHCENDCAIELDCDEQDCEAPALFVTQHQLSGGHPMGDDYYIVTVARCRAHSTITRGMPDA